MDLKQIKEETKTIIEDVIAKTEIKAGQIFVLGLSSSEVNGGTIGKNSSAEIGEVIVGTIYEALKARDIYLAVQACEHLNRALLIEQELADKKIWKSFRLFHSFMQEGVDKSQLISYLRHQ